LQDCEWGRFEQQGGSNAISILHFNWSKLEMGDWQIPALTERRLKLGWNSPGREDKFTHRLALARCLLHGNHLLLA